MSGGCKATDSNNSVILSLALILVLKFLGGGGHVKQALESLNIRNGLSCQRTSQHTHTMCNAATTTTLPHIVYHPLSSTLVVLSPPACLMSSISPSCCIIHHPLTPHILYLDLVVAFILSLM